MKNRFLFILVALFVPFVACAVTPLPDALAKLPLVAGEKPLEKEIRPGVTYHQRHFENFTGDGPLALHFFVVDWSKVDKTFSFTVIPGKDGNRSRPSDLANATPEAFAAVNGVFFQMTDPYLPFFARKINGVVSPSKHAGGDGCFAFNPGEMPYIGKFSKDALAKYAYLISADGMPDINPKEAEMTPAARQRLRAPRTFAGNVTTNRLTIIGVADGRQKRSTGLSYSEVRKVLESWGCDQLTNLDGGGSSVVILKGIAGVKGTQTNGKCQIMNVPSDGSPRRPTERRVAESLMLIERSVKK